MRLSRILSTCIRPVIIALLGTGSAWAMPIVSLDLSSTSVNVGGSFSVDVRVDGVEASDRLLAFGFDVTNDAEITFVSATVDPRFFDDSAFFATTDVAGSAFN